MHLETLNNGFKIISLSETWFNINNVSAYNIENFSHEYLLRANKMGGGVSIFIDKSVEYKTRNDLNKMESYVEALWIEIQRRDKSNLLIGTIYRPPGTDTALFNDYMTYTLSIITKEKKNVVHMGDYNLDLINSGTHRPTNEFIEINYANLCIPLINKPTRITNNSSTLIDNIFSNIIEDDLCNKGILYWSISDHFPVFYLHKTEPDNTEKKTPHKR